MKNEKGITLVALIVIIIVLLILAGISITMLTGDNGLLAKVQDAKEKTEQAKTNERLDLLKQEELIDEVLNGVNVEKVTDNKPGELEKENENTFIINSIEDLVFFAYDVTNGNNYEGKTVKLGTSLDFNSTKSYVDPLRTDYGKYGYDGELKTLLTTKEGFIPIGTIYDRDVSMNHFCGIFDGNYNAIYNLYQDVKDSEKVIITGLFGTNMGTIKNLKMENINLNGTTNNMNILMGAIAGRNSGNIENCSTAGKINIIANGVKSIFAGGISGQGDSSGIENSINKCYSLANIKININNLNSVNVGGIGNINGTLIKNSYFKGKIEINGQYEGELLSGITGIGTSEKIENCYNLGELVQNIKNNNTYIGGITNGKGAKNCYNLGNILSNSTLNHIGGIDANAQDTEINNCYNIGNLIKVDEATGLFGALTSTGKNLVINNSKWLVNTAEMSVSQNLGNVTDNSICVNTLEEMPTIIEVVNGEGVFKEDTNNINNGYPILYWE